VKGEGDKYDNFCLYFHPDNHGRNMLNVLPDFFAPGTVEIDSIRVNGVTRASFTPSHFQLELNDDELGSQVVVEFRPKWRA
jgi:hypothetical protein